jgi:5-methyltetrahydropteroyltriglutamate--homocysteine methyltransferase
MSGAPRPDDWLEMMLARERNEGVDAQAYAARGRQAVADIVNNQVELGIDVVDDGEQGKTSFLTYVNEKLGGFEPAGPKGSPWAGSREEKSFPEFYAAAAAGGGGGPGRGIQMLCTGPIIYKGQEPLRRDLDNFAAALTGQNVLEAFVPAISPGNMEHWQRNAYYESDEAFLFAIADAMHEEYQAIVDAGFILQIDDPRHQHGPSRARHGIARPDRYRPAGPRRRVFVRSRQPAART